jgi:hypothetical protein
MTEFGRSVERLRPALRHARETMSSEVELNALARISEELRIAMTPPTA